ncbi:MAG: hypothetical protein IT445_05820, partial [Phycisphaeraceae bacterium]|nr:hypothetical protein [Phycisphaeraceae bacterium]
MADKETTATPAGNPADIDVKAIVQDAVKQALEQQQTVINTAVAEAIKPITAQVQTLQTELGKAATSDTVTKAVADAIAAQTASQAKTASRAEFIQKNLKDIPDAFHSMIGDDPAKWDEQAKALRASLKSAGAKVGDDTTVSGDGRQAMIDKIVKEKLGGNADLGKLLTGQTAGELDSQADMLLAGIKKFKPDFGGVAKDGGDAPNDARTDSSASTLSGVSPGVAAYAKSIKF